MNQDKNSLTKNIFELKNGSKLYLCSPAKGQDKQQKIINLIKSLQKQNKQQKYILVTKKPSFRIIASTQNIDTQDFNDIGQFQNSRGWKYVDVTQQQMVELKYTKDDLVKSQLFKDTAINNYIIPRYNNQLITNTIYRIVQNGVGKVIDRKPHLCGISPRNQQQMMAVDLLLNNDIPFVCLAAIAGCGKTLLTLCAALQKTLVEKEYRKIVITRPVIPIGRDIGFLPGDLQDKMQQWLLPFWNNIDYIASINKSNGKNKFSIQKLKILLDKQQRKQFIQILPISYMRGCSISNSYVIIDQAQNTTPSQMRTIITRIGQNSKLVLTGDLQQIDNPYLSKETNGLSMSINKFKNQDMFGYLQLDKSQRSKLSKLANQILF